MFKKFKTLPYALDGYSKEAMNLLTAGILKHVNVDQTFVYQKYNVPAGMSAESLANELYKDAGKYWTILLVNSIVDPFNEWPMDSTALENYTKHKHGSTTAILYFINVNTRRRYDDVDEETYRQLIADDQPIPELVHPVTAIEHESVENQKRCEIMVVAPRYISLFEDTFNKAIEGKS